MLSYRIDRYVHWFTFPVAVTVASYVGLSVLMLVVGNAASFWLPRVIAKRQLGHGLLTALVFGSFALLALLFGPFGVDVPMTRVRGIFFAEWKFVSFIFIDAVILTALYYLLLIRPSEVDKKANA